MTDFAVNINDIEMSVHFAPSVLSQEWTSQAIIEFRNKLKHRKSRMLFDVWNSLIKDKIVPFRKEITLRLVSEVTGNLVILHYEKEHDDWRVINVGEEVIGMHGHSPLGELCHNFSDTNTQEFWISNAKKVQQGIPFVEYFTLEYADKGYIEVESLNLPLRDNKSGEIEIVMGLLIAL